MKKLFILTLISFLFGSTNAQSDALEKAWNLFNDNKLNEAVTAFQTARTDENLKEEALIGLTMTYEELLKPNLSKESFLEFVNVSKNPYPYVYSMWYSDGMSLGTDYDKQTLDFYQKILRDDNAEGIIKAMINERIGNYYAGKGEMSTARSYADAIGSIKTWQTLGSFENISASGFDKDFGALEKPKAGDVFKNKRNAVVKWFDIKQVKNGRWIDLTYHHYTDNSIIYSQTFCNSPTEQQVQLRIGTSGSVKVWVNDNLVISDNKETNNNLDTYIQEVKLNKGNNRILVQIGCSEIDRSNFMCRFTDNKGNPINNLTYSYNYSEYSKENTFKGKSIRNPYEVYFENKIKENPTKVLNYVLLSQVYWRNRKSFETRKTLAKAEELSPKSTYILTLKAYVLSVENNSTGLSKLLEQIKETDPESYLALDLQYDEYIDQENYEEAEKIVNTLKSRYGWSVDIYNKKIALASNNKEVEKLKNLVYQAYKKYPNNYDIVGLKYAVEKQINKSSAAYKILTKYGKKNYNTNAKTDLAGYYFDRGLPYKGIQIYKDLVKDHPAGSGYRKTLAQIDFAMNNYQGAINYYNECLEIAPYVSLFYEGIGQAYEEMNQDDKAIENYKKAIEYSPNDYEVREKLRILENKEKLFLVFETPKDPEFLLKDSPTAEDYPEDQSLMLLEEDQKIVYKDGASEEKHYRMVKVLNPSGVDNWKEYSINVYGNQRLIVEEAKVYKQDGSKIDAETNYNYIVFTDLEVGDAIYVVYKLENYNSGKLAKHFWDKHYFNYFMPVQRNAYSLLIHKDKKFQYDVINSTMEPVIEEHGEFLLYKWEKENIAATKGEPYMPPLSDVGEILHISSFQNWSEIADWYTDLAETKQEADFEVKEKVKELFEGKENLTDKEKAKIIYNYIVNDIRYSSISFRQSGLIPQKASSVINTKLGDCKDVSTLFVTMCKEVGIDANLVLVNTRDEGDEDLHFPSINFNHCIAKVNFKEQSQYVELTSDLLPFSTFGNSLKNATALNIVEGANIIKLKSDKRVPNTSVRKSAVSFTGDKMLVEKENKKGGYLSASMRSSYRDIGREQQEKDMTEAIQGKYLKTKLKDLEFDSTLTINTPYINYKYSYTVDDAFNDVGGIYIVKFPWSDDSEIQSFLSTETRNFPIALWKFTYTDNYHEELVITLPSDKKLVKTPDNIVYNNNFFNYSLTYVMKDNKLTANRKFKFKVDTVSPKDYKEFKDAYEKVIKADAKQLALNDK